MAKKRKISKKNKNYFMKFFDGELSLPHSYWLVGIVYSIVVGILAAVIMLSFSLPDRSLSVLILPWIIFVSIGVWRSSDKYKGPKFWAILAKIAVVISIIQSISDVLRGV